MTAQEYIETMHRIRSARLRDLMETFGNQYTAAEEIGLSQSYLSRLCQGKEKFGEVVARKIEDNFGLEYGALDRPMGDAA